MYAPKPPFEGNAQPIEYEDEQRVNPKIALQIAKIKRRMKS